MRSGKSKNGKTMEIPVLYSQESSTIHQPNRGVLKVHSALATHNTPVNPVPIMPTVRNGAGNSPATCGDTREAIKPIIEIMPSNPVSAASIFIPTGTV